MKRAVFIISFLLIVLIVKSQSDCKYYYEYNGKIKIINKEDTSSITILVPIPFWLGTKTINKYKNRAFCFENISLQKGDSLFNKKFSMLGSCKGREAEYLARTCISHIKEYPIIIKYGITEKIIFIRIDEILFNIKGGFISIGLPLIKL